MDQVEVQTIGIISDTHIPTKAEKIPPKIFDVFSDASLIIHAGDLTQLSILQELRRVAPVVAVCGNMDEFEVRAELPEINSVEIYDWKLGVKHDPGAFWGTWKMEKVAKQNNFSILVFGHTHRPAIKREQGIVFINPGSPTNPIPLPSQEVRRAFKNWKRESAARDHYRLKEAYTGSFCSGQVR
ncbi:metallophosphoesterase [Candidatus Bathyarchaeota archaeon]|nr:metallophosphoesterase [Candidatus Bathyarchaeota archaeon]